MSRRCPVCKYDGRCAGCDALGEQLAAITRERDIALAMARYFADDIGDSAQGIDQELRDAREYAEARIK